MAAFEKRGQHWRVKIRRKGYPEQTRSFDLKSQAEAWARSIENDMDKGVRADPNLSHRADPILSQG